MGDSLQQTPATGVRPAEEIEEFDAIIIGAGVTGLYQLYRLRERGFSVRVFEDGSGVGGTWYWNRYPGARFDSESYTYGYSFSQELLQEWDWKEHFSGQVENERYLNYVADKFDLKRHIQFNSRVSSAVFETEDDCWLVQTEDGHQARGRFLVSAVGILSAHYIPEFEGLESFKGAWCHTGRWPKEGMDLADKQVGVVGTGATAVQLIPEIAKEVAHLTVFQRTPNYCAPLRNSEIAPETQRRIKASYSEIFQMCRETPSAFMHQVDPRSALEVSPEERLAQYEGLWAEPGFKKWLSNFHDIFTNEEANETYAEFVRNKIIDRVHDPVVAQKLAPTDHPFGSKRIPLETGYYEAYNRENVSLVDVREAPIERITPEGIKTSDGAEHHLDVIIFATGYDAITGALTRIDVRGEGGQSIKDAWADGPRTFLGVQTSGFPNLFTLNSAATCNFPRCAEAIVEWTTDCIGHMRDGGHTRIETTPQAEEAWTQHAAELAAGSIRMKADSWFVGANIPGKARVLLLYPDSAPSYRAKCAEVAANGYEGFLLR